MTEPGGAQAPERSPAPVPLDGQRPLRPGRARLVVTVVLAAVTLLAAFTFIAFRVLEKPYERLVDFQKTNMISGNVGAVMSADGRFLFIQWNDRFGETAITAVDTVTGQARRLDGHWIAAVEPSGARLRVMEDPGTSPQDLVRLSDAEQQRALDNPGVFLSPGEYWDAADVQTLVWDLDTYGDPVYEAWKQVEGADGIAASFTVDTRRGVYPVSVNLTSDEGSVTLAPGRTFLPVGWSPSGRYYATAELPQDTAADQEIDRTVTVRIWSVEDGSQLASARFRPSLGTQILWSPVEDAVYWSQMGPPSVVRSLRPGERPKTTVLPATVASSSPVVVGCDDEGVLLRTLVGERRAGDEVGPHAHFRVGRDGKAIRSGSDTVRALIVASGPRATSWWRLRSLDEEVNLNAAGIKVWLGETLESTPAVVFQTGSPNLYE